MPRFSIHVLLTVAIVCAREVVAFNPFNYGAGKTPGLEWFGKSKLGMFMHYGPVTQWGTEISFPLVCQSFPCSPMGPGNVPVQINNSEQLSKHRQSYFDLQKTFNPNLFDADDMAEKAKKAGFKYLIYTTVHCDGFVNWPSNLTDYNIMNTPYKRDIYGDLVRAFRKRGLKVGAYVCPSLWSNNSYWTPDAQHPSTNEFALTGMGGACRPNYIPAEQPAKWSKFQAFLHGLVDELTVRYAPDAWWFDCSNHPPFTDTKLEVLMAKMREANPNTVVNIRGGIWSDYSETNDQSEQDVRAIMGQQQMSAGIQFEIPAVLQASRQWAFDPKSKQKSAKEVIANLIMITAKGGNYLMNVAPGPDGKWAADAEAFLSDMAAWLSVNGESLFDTSPVYPFQDGDVYFTKGMSHLYLITPGAAPDTKLLARSSVAIPTGAPQLEGPEACVKEAPGSVEISSNLKNSSCRGKYIPVVRAALLSQPLASVELLGHGPVQFELREDGLCVVLGGTPVPGAFDCSLFGCDCHKAAAYYNIVGCNGLNVGGCGFGCAPAEGQQWWRNEKCEVDVQQSGPHPGCSGGTPFDNGYVLKLGFKVPSADYV